MKVGGGGGWREKTGFFKGSSKGRGKLWTKGGQFVDKLSCHVSPCRPPPSPSAGQGSCGDGTAP